jgi:hypothetical protein
MATNNKKTNPIPKMPSLNFGKSKLSYFSKSKNPPIRGFVPPTFRITQHKGGGGK